MQRARILDAMVRVVAGYGYIQASVTSVCVEARVSRSTFYAIFGTLEECFLVVLDEGARRAGVLISQAFESERFWLDGVSSALAGLLVFFDCERELAYVLLVEATAAGPRARERRERHVAELTSMIEERWGSSEHDRRHPLAAAGVIASLLGVLHTHLVRGGREPLVALLGPLTGLVVAPYLSPSAVTVEIERADELARGILAEQDRRQEPHAGCSSIPAALCDPRAHRARDCVLYLAAHPEASNRQVAVGIGIATHTQISALLARLLGKGLLEKSAGAPGHPNAWSLTQAGLEASQALAAERHRERPPLRTSARSAYRF